MGIVVAFPEGRSAGRASVDQLAGSATVIILPVVRIERFGEGPPSDAEPSSVSSGRKRRRRASRP
jgi:hypothetical protein